jgi:hypothetical protein
VAHTVSGSDEARCLRLGRPAMCRCAVPHLTGIGQYQTLAEPSLAKHSSISRRWHRRRGRSTTDRCGRRPRARRPARPCGVFAYKHPDSACNNMASSANSSAVAWSIRSASSALVTFSLNLSSASQAR